MRKLYRILALIVLPLFALRFVDAVQNINLATGFYDSGSSFLRVLSVLAVVAVVLVMRMRVKSAEIEDSASPRANLVCSVYFALTSVTVLLSSALQIFKALDQAGGFRQLFMSKKALYLAGFTTTHFRIEFWCGVVGILAAAWFAFAAMRFFLKDGNLSGRPLFSCVPIVWYCLRAVSDFSLAPVNPNNALIITFIAVDLVLGLFYLRYARYTSLGHNSEDARRMIPYGMLAFVFTLSFKAPLVAVLPQESTDILLALADCFSAVTAFVATDITLKGSAPREQKVD